MWQKKKNQQQSTATINWSINSWVSFAAFQRHKIYRLQPFPWRLTATCSWTNKQTNVDTVLGNHKQQISSKKSWNASCSSISIKHRTSIGKDSDSSDFYCCTPRCWVIVVFLKLKSKQVRSKLHEVLGVFHIYSSISDTHHKCSSGPHAFFFFLHLFSSFLTCYKVFFQTLFKNTAWTGRGIHMWICCDHNQSRRVECVLAALR